MENDSIAIWVQEVARYRAALKEALGYTEDELINRLVADWHAAMLSQALLRFEMSERTMRLARAAKSVSR